jgi:hypothetical protein
MDAILAAAAFSGGFLGAGSRRKPWSQALTSF